MLSRGLLVVDVAAGGMVAVGGGGERRGRAVAKPTTSTQPMMTTTTMHRLPTTRTRTQLLLPRATDEGSTSAGINEAPVATVEGGNEERLGECPVLTPFRSPSTDASSSTSSSSSSSTTSTSTSSSSSSAVSSLPLPPGSVGIPFLGESAEMMRNPALFHGSRRREHGDIYKTKILGGKVIVVHGSVPCKKFLLGDNTLTTTDWPVATRRIMGERSILLQSGSKHASQRRLLGQAFTREAVDGYAPLIESAIVSNLESWAEEGCVKGISAGKDLAFEVAARALIASGDDVMSNETMRLFREDFDRVVEGMLALPYDLGPFSKFGRALRARRRVLSRIDALIDGGVERKKKREEEKSCSSSSSSSSSSFSSSSSSIDNDSDKENDKKKKSRNALDLLLSAVDPETGEAATREELRDQILTQLFAGHETTGTTIARLLRELSSRPDVLSRLREEQDRCVETRGDALTPAALLEMPYADAVVAETLRVWPIVNGVFRSALRDLEVEAVDAEGQKKMYRVPRGWRLLLMISSTTRESAPPVFDPDRWLSPATSPSSSSSSSSSSLYAPFGLGPHICLGMSLALLELKAVLAELVRRYDWELLDPSERWEPPLLPEKGVPVLFWRRSEGKERGRKRTMDAARLKGLVE